jgi:hypothetical protein
MKTKKIIFKIFLTLIAAVTFYSCDNPLALGAMLDIQGPVVEITAPTPRKSVPVQFDIEGTVTDYSGVTRMIMKASANNVDFPRQWRYQKGVWEISEDSGTTWLPFADAQFNGTEKSGEWKIFVDMDVNGQKVDGEYTFTIQAWDKGEISDDNSFKTIVLILDLDPPKVDVSRPVLYRGNAAYESAPLKDLHDMLDSDLSWQTPAYLGRFITQEFTLNWQIEDSHNVWSVDLRFYPYDTDIDNDPDTPLPDNYIYRYYKNMPPPPSEINPADYVKPNGFVKVPDLDITAGLYDGGGEIKNRITEKTTIKVVAACFDAAGNANQEKTLGYFIYWPKANSPWIVFSEGLEPPDNFYGKTIASIESDVVMAYPGRSIKATAFQSHGVKEVQYSLYKCDTAGGTLNSMILDPLEREKRTIPNKPYSEGMYSNVFPWEFEVPARTGYYVVKAQAFSSQNIGSEEYYILFRVQDITFPDFPTPPNPIASEPLFKAINANKITIEGIVSDATEIDSLCMVWINPESEGYKAMNQLSYFRDKDYQGWKDALALSPGGTTTEGNKDPANPNRLWKLGFTSAGVDIETNRRLFSYSQVIDLNDLNIGMNKQPLRSQIFLLRAQNPDGKCTIITYAPQGDTLAPVISITEVVINRSGVNDPPCIPGAYAIIQPLVSGNTITIKGTWREDSLGYLPMGTYFTPNFNITVNNQRVSGSPLPLTPPVLTNISPTEGTWTITTTVGSSILPESKLKDTLAISADVKDIGGNYAEAGCSWLIQSDNLRLMRISSEEEDKTYKAGDIVEIFLEFSKPVKLLNTNAVPVLLLNSTGTGTAARAVYRTSPAQSNQNSRQYFVYTVDANQDTMSRPEGFLNVTGLENAGVITAANYPFAWFKGEGTDREEVRITMTAGQNGNTKDPVGGYYSRTLPTTTVTTNADYPYTLLGGKHIAVDTAAPIVTSISSNTPNGYYNAGDIYMTVNFSKPVTIDTASPPRLTLQVTNGASTTVSTDAGAGDVKVSGNAITFKYSIKPNDTTNGNAVLITNYTGTISGLAGNTLLANGISSLAAENRTLTGVYIETLAPAVPTVRVLPGNVTANNANVVQNNVSGTTNQGLSTYANRNLSNLYSDALWFAIQPSGAAYKYRELEYSINNGTTWVKAPNTANTPFSISQTGSYNLVARQIDMAGNVSASTNVISFTWDPGTLISRIISTTPNGTYTHVAGRNQVDITVNFRKPLYISGTPQLTINAQRGGNNINVTTYVVSAARDSITFTYTVANGDSIPAAAGVYLDVTGISGFTAWDGNATGNGVNVSSMIATANLPSGLVAANKQLRVETGNLNVLGTLSFVPDNTGVTDVANEGNANFYGIRSDDGSYWTSLDIPFNRNITKGSGNITITQDWTNYRLPSVLTEAQYNRFKGIANIDTHYTKGTNGFNYTSATVSSSDTSTKYILNYSVDTAAAANRPAANNGGGTAMQQFAHNFRIAEAVTISVNAQAVTVVNNNTLRIRLSGGSAPQVPGARYTVSCENGIVNDILGNAYAAANYDVTLRGVAKPFVRVKKNQDIISAPNGAGNGNSPRLTAAQPMTAEARMDCRTPASTITYNATTWESPVINNNNNVTNNNWTAGGNPTENAAKKENRPASATGTNYGAVIPIGNNNYNGYQWWVRARATTNAGANTSAETEEVAFRTVITYQFRRAAAQAGNPATAVPAPGAGELILGNGDQIWIRGGDAIGSSSIPGFPFTWEDNWNNLVGKRAGIRLMTKTNAAGTANNDTATSLNLSVWKFVTWEINVAAYVDFILGRDLTEVGPPAYTASALDVAWQYGPKRWAYQRAGWTSFKDKYPIFPGEHRWCDAGYDNQNKGDINFSGTFSARPDGLTVNIPNANQ